MEIAIVFLMAMGLGLVTGQTPDYCNVRTCILTSGKTARCNNVALSTWGPSCGSPGDYINSSIIPLESQQGILDIHNQIRSSVALGKAIKAYGKEITQPTASNMRKMVWDKELYEMAQALIQQCIGEETDNLLELCGDVSRFRVGLNIALTPKTSASKGVNPFINSWAKEGSYNMAPEFVDKFDRRGASGSKRYTQMVWANTYALGCAAGIYGNNNLFVCVYGPVGNTLGKSVYKRGAAGSACPVRTKMEADTGLCTALPETTPDYCNVATCTETSGKTALCGYADFSTWDSSCGNNHSNSSAFLPEDQQYILNLHNQLRSDIAQGKVKDQPPASNMRKMQWDEELAQMAQANIQNGFLDYYTDDCRDVGRFQVGQNNYYQYFSSREQQPPVKDIFKDLFDTYGQKWTLGMKRMTQDYIDDIRKATNAAGIFKADLTKYANLVSADTYLIGCAGARYTFQRTILRITCNYGPVMGSTGAIYRRGAAGTACPAGTNKEAATGLCA